MNIGSILRLGSGGMSGNSSKSGFCVNSVRDQIFKTVNYENSDLADSLGFNKPNFKKIFLILFYSTLILSSYLMTSMMSSYVSIIFQGVSLLGLLSLLCGLMGSIVMATYLTMLIAILFATIKFRFVHSKNTLEYHACEHMVISLIKSNTAATMDNLRKMPRVSITCGSMFSGTIIFSPIIFLNTFWLVPKISIYLIPIGTLLSLFIVIILSLALQFIVYTKSPSDDKLEESLVVAKEVYKFQKGEDSVTGIALKEA